MSSPDWCTQIAVVIWYWPCRPETFTLWVRFGPPARIWHLCFCHRFKGQKLLCNGTKQEFVYSKPLPICEQNQGFDLWPHPRTCWQLCGVWSAGGPPNHNYDLSGQALTNLYNSPVFLAERVKRPMERTNFMLGPLSHSGVRSVHIHPAHCRPTV